MFPEFGDVLKHTYVDVAARQLEIAGLESTVEAISVIVNLDTNAVRNCLQSADDATYRQAERELNPVPRVLAAWHTDSNYSGPYGVLRDLPFSGSGGVDEKVAGSFAELASRYCPGISPNVLLDELIRTGCVQDVGNGFYRAVKRSYIPDPLSAQSIRRFARVVHNICETLEVNLRADSTGDKGSGGKLLERTIYTVHGISKTELKEFDMYIRERGQLFADDVDNWLSTRDQEGREDVTQTGIGFYHYVVNEQDEREFVRELPV
jgi:hypothetical protein